MDPVLQFMVVGVSGVGKSRLVLQFQEKTQSNVLLTAVEDSAIKFEFVEITDTVTCQENLAYFEGALLVYDITRKETLKNLVPWLQSINRYRNDNMSIVLVGNKSDLAEEREVSLAEGAQFAKENGLLFVEVSATEGLMIQEAFSYCAYNAHHKIEDVAAQKVKEEEEVAVQNEKETHGAVAIAKDKAVVAAQEEGDEETQGAAIPQNKKCGPTARELKKALKKEEKQRVKKEKTSEARKKTEAIKIQEKLLGIKTIRPKSPDYTKKPPQRNTIAHY